MNRFEKLKKMDINEVAAAMDKLGLDPCEFCPFDTKPCEFCNQKFSAKDLFVKYLEAEDKTN